MSTEISQLIADVRERVLFLQELGVDALGVELSAGVPAAPINNVKPATAPEVAEKAPPPETLTLPKRERETTRPSGSRLAALPSLAKRASPKAIRGASPTDMKQPDPAPVVSEEPPFEEEIHSLMQVADVADTIDSIRAEIGDCTRCPLAAGRTQVVHTTGNFNADLMFIGEAPGANEDAQGLPFVGRAGKLLTDIIAAMGYSRDEVAIGNINRCRPPDNRTPTLPEAHTCRPFLLREIAVIAPRVIVVMGNTAYHNLLDTKEGITRARGKFQDYFGVKVMPTFHPAYLLRDPHKKREVWEDMKVVRDYLATEDPSKKSI